MIWHFVEVWLLVVLVFVIGCLLGAWLYGVVAESRLATVQGVVADSIGDVVDRIKARLGVGPAWRPVHLGNIERPAPAAGGSVGAERADLGHGHSEARETNRVAEPAAAHRDDPPIAGRGLRGERTARIAASADEEPIFADTPVRTGSTTAAGGADGVVATRPAGLGAPRGGVPDNLQRVKGIGKRNEALLNRLGIYHFGQIAAWTPGEVRWIGRYLAFPERIERDDWVGQAMVLAMGSDTGFEKSAERRRRRRQQEREFVARMTLASEPEVEPPEPESPEGAALVQAEEVLDEALPESSFEEAPGDAPVDADDALDAEFEDVEPFPDDDKDQPR